MTTWNKRNSTHISLSQVSSGISCIITSSKPKPALLTILPSTPKRQKHHHEHCPNPSTPLPPFQTQDNFLTPFPPYHPLIQNHLRPAQKRKGHKDSHIQPPPNPHRHPNRPPHTLLIPHIRPYKNRLPRPHLLTNQRMRRHTLPSAPFLPLRYPALDRSIRLQIRTHHKARAFPRERKSHRSAQTRRGAGDESDFVMETAGGGDGSTVYASALFQTRRERRQRVGLKGSGERHGTGW